MFGAIGALAFGSAFVTSYVNPGFVESIAKDVIRSEVEKRVREKVDSIDQRFLGGSAGRFLKGHSNEIALLQKQLAEGLPQRLATVIGEMRDPNCECRRKIEATYRAGLESRIGAVSQAAERLDTLIRSKYMETANQLTREFRIFTGTNAIVFALLAVATLTRSRAGLHLVPPAIVLLVAAMLTAYLYVFNQNWLHTIVFSDYVGFTYVAYLGVAFFFLCDILFNRARITTGLLNALFSAVGSAVCVLPC